MASADVTCAHCGAQFPQIKSRGRPRRFCTKECMASFHAGVKRERKGIEPRWADGIPTCHKDFTCYWCEEPFKPRKAGFTKCCSRECGFEWLRASRAIIKRATFCVRITPSKPIKVAAPDVRTCTGCSTEFKVELYARDLCGSCRDAKREETRAKHKRITKSRRRALIRTSKVEAVDPFKVFDRDGWRCHLCGRKTPKALRGTHKHNAPELDHIIPLAKGGDHSYANTACSCRRCNWTKSDTIIGQPSLFTVAA